VFQPVGHATPHGCGIEPLGRSHWLDPSSEAHRVGAVLLHHRIHHVADVFDSPPGGVSIIPPRSVTVGGAVEQAGRDGEQRVEPPAGLVQALADEVGRKVPAELGVVLERPVPLGREHRARIEPRVDHLGHAPHASAAHAAREDDLVHHRLVGIEVVAKWRTHALR
jgi:hypothetical protein